MPCPACGKPLQVIDEERTLTRTIRCDCHTFMSTTISLTLAREPFLTRIDVMADALNQLKAVARHNRLDVPRWSPPEWEPLDGTYPPDKTEDEETRDEWSGSSFSVPPEAWINPASRPLTDIDAAMKAIWGQTMKLPDTLVVSPVLYKKMKELSS